MCIKCGARNTFGICVSSKEDNFPVLSDNNTVDADPEGWAQVMLKSATGHISRAINRVSVKRISCLSENVSASIITAWHTKWRKVHDVFNIKNSSSVRCLSVKKYNFVVAIKPWNRRDSNLMQSWASSIHSRGYLLDNTIVIYSWLRHLCFILRLPWNCRQDVTRIPDFCQRYQRWYALVQCDVDC